MSTVWEGYEQCQQRHFFFDETVLSGTALTGEGHRLNSAPTSLITTICDGGQLRSGHWRSPEEGRRGRGREQPVAVPKHTRHRRKAAHTYS